jgi:F-type H+-transporting ATPase subunit epsilon
VTRIVAQTPQGSFGLLPQRLDCAAVLAPGILIYETEPDGVCYVAVDQGVLVKAGVDVLVSVRKAIGEMDLARLHEAVMREFLDVNEQEKKVRTALATMESELIRRLMDIQHG